MAVPRWKAAGNAANSSGRNNFTFSRPAAFINYARRQKSIVNSLIFPGDFPASFITLSRAESAAS
jgi:hypothetical protein